MRALVFVMAVLLIAGRGTPCAAIDSGDKPLTQGLTEAKRLYYDGIGGNKKSIEQSARIFSELSSAEPENAEVKAYRGSLMLLEAGKTWAVWRKYDLSKSGMTLLDDAVRQAPSNLEVRFVRAATTMHLPAFFSRDQQSKDDLSFIAKQASDAVRRGELDPRIAAAALLFYAQRVAKGEDRRAALEEATHIAPDSPAGKEAEGFLHKMQTE